MQATTCMIYFRIILEKIRCRFKPTQRFVTAGGLQGSMAEKAMLITHQTEPIVDERLTSNAEESDTRIWLRVFHSAGTRKLVLSPDTDVYHIWDDNNCRNSARYNRTAKPI